MPSLRNATGRDRPDACGAEVRGGGSTCNARLSCSRAIITQIPSLCTIVYMEHNTTEEQQDYVKFGGQGTLETLEVTLFLNGAGLVSSLVNISAPIYYGAGRERGVSLNNDSLSILFPSLHEGWQFCVPTENLRETYAFMDSTDT
ncbi:hypothetical protein DM02DRAFT_628027 [Periconia macrospinosa]|uniref:Uncharacterized protein n=1 Tax=Periconia macrospinosa TaxID=97972 RepID=A0A2V1DUS7_9PLEO|nr:hypothetical protein DM02DRAFT_628027 [Periconia macrospinosa]